MWVSEQFANFAGLIYGDFTDGDNVGGKEALHFRSGVTDQVCYQILFGFTSTAVGSQ